MTSKDAIKLIQGIEEDGRNVTKEHIEALDLAIKALEERPQGDLISREALKKSFEDTVCIEPMPYAFVKQIIDNAPTVEAIPTELHEKILDQTTGELLECQSHLRPQGKWIMITEPDGYIHSKCSNCNQFNAWGDVAFCPWCGADMRGKEE